MTNFTFMIKQCIFLQNFINLIIENILQPKKSLNIKRKRYKIKKVENV